MNIDSYYSYYYLNLIISSYNILFVIFYVDPYRFIKFKEFAGKEIDIIGNCRKIYLKNLGSLRVIYNFAFSGGVTFVEEIPKNPSGKILRKKLRDT